MLSRQRCGSAVPEDAVWQEVRRLQAERRIERPLNDSEGAPTDLSAAQDDRPGSLPAEKLLLQLMLTDERIVGVVAERLDRAWLTQSAPGKLIGYIVDLLISGRWDGSDTLLNQVSDEEEKRLLAELMLTAQPKMAGVQATTDCLAALERRALEQQLRELRRQLSQPDLTKSATVALQQQVLDLRRKLDHIAPLSMDKTKLVSHS